MPTNHTPTAVEITTVVELPNDGEVWSHETVMKVSSGNKGPVAKALDYAQWIREKVVDFQYITPTGSGNAYPGSSWTNLSESEDFKLTFTDVKVGDKILLLGACQLSTLDSSSPTFRWGNTTGSIVCDGAVVPASVSEPRLVLAGYTVASAAASLELFLQVNPAGASSGVEVDGDTTTLIGALHRLTT